MISDVRARDQAERISARAGVPALGVPGGRVTPDLMLPKIVWLREHEPEHFERARWFASPNDFLVHRLTGEVADRPDRTPRSTSRRPRDRLPAGLLAALDIPVATLPPVVGGGASRAARSGPRCASGTACPDDVRVVLSTYDAICAVYGSGVADGRRRLRRLRARSRASAPSRTGADRDPAGRLFTIRPRRDRAATSPAAPTTSAAASSSGRSRSSTRTTRAPYETMVAEATEAPPGAAGLTFLPYLLGERAPVWDSNARAVFFGLGRNHGRADMIRAIFEGVGYSVIDIADRLGRDGRRGPSGVGVRRPRPTRRRSTRSSRTCSACRSC